MSATTVPSPSPAEELAALLEGMLPVVQESVDDFEVAVLLEARGVTDEQARRYGCTDVFELAHQLRAETAPGPRAPAPLRKDWYPTAPAAVLRGLVFTLAALAIMTAVGLEGGSEAVLVVLIANTIGVAVMQPVAFLAYLSIERSGPSREPSSIRPLLWVLVLVPALVVGAGLGTGDWKVGLISGAALAYLMGMALLLVLGRTILVALIVLPVAVLAVIEALQPDLVNDDIIVAGWLLGAVLLLVGVVVCSRRRTKAKGVRLGWVDVRAALPFALAGAVVGTVVIGNLLLVRDAPPIAGHGTRDWLIVALPFLVPVSFAEMLVVWVRRRLHQATTTTISPKVFRRLGRRRCYRLWFVQLTLSAAVAAAVVPLLEGDLADRILLAASFALLAVVLTTSLLLLASEALTAQILLLGLCSAAMAAAWLVLRTEDPTSMLIANVAILGTTTLFGTVLATRAASTFWRYR